MTKPPRRPSLVDRYFDPEFGWMFDDDKSRAEIIAGFAGDLDGYWDAKRAALLLDVSPSTIRQYARQKKIPAVRVGKSWRFRGRDLMDYLKSQCHFTNESAVRIKTGGLGSESIKSRLEKVRAQATANSRKPSNTR